MVQQRKYRNRDERLVIRNEVIGQLSQLTTSDDAIHKLVDVLDVFVEQEGEGRLLVGTIDLPNIDARIEYKLPGRRVQSHFVRIVPNKK